MKEYSTLTKQEIDIIVIKGDEGFEILNEMVAEH